jgi:tRNA A37 N6-isopentenylltransferase MiaA
MWNNGLVKEYQNLLSLGYSKDLNSLNTVGYKEVDMYLNNLLTQSEALEESLKSPSKNANIFLKTISFIRLWK